MNNNIFTRSAKALLMITILASLAFPALSTAAPAYATIIKGGVAIEGDVVLAGREGTIQIEDYSHNVSVAYDDATGFPPQRAVKQHRVVRLVKLLDKTSPKLFDIMASAGTMESVTFEFWKPGGSGDVKYYTVVLTNANIVSIIPHKSDVSDAMLESISLTYEIIYVKDGDGSGGYSEASDTWVQP